MPSYNNLRFKNNIIDKVNNKDGFNYSYNGVGFMSTDKEVPLFKPIKWYTCGPTIYDSAHLGHARTYLVFDIMRRIINHFQGSTIFAMNITDIDDKIIKKVKETGVNYNEFIKKMETEFFTDMDNLNIMRPTIITRVTEYIPHIVNFIDLLITADLAYEVNESVYFDMEKYKELDMDTDPFGLNIKDTEYTESTYVSEKRSKNDFVLWKKSKDDELNIVSYDSPWGKGRPGWHIECNVMIDSIFGNHFDVHSGGIDLQFPHHTNEYILAHAYAYAKGEKYEPYKLGDKDSDHRYGEKDWVFNFIHSGHLNIAGCKMSKSLKNFVTIKDFLANVGTANDLRMLVLLHAWDKPLDYNEDTLEEAKQYNSKLIGFLKHLEFILKLPDDKNIPDQDVQFQTDIYNILLIINQIEYPCDTPSLMFDNFNTKEVMEKLSLIMKKTYVYLEKSQNKGTIQYVYDEIMKLIKLLGLEYNLNSNLDTDVNKFVELGVKLREDIRDILKTNKKNIAKDTLNKFYAVLDEFRNTKLKKVGIVLQDIDDITKWSIE